MNKSEILGKFSFFADATPEFQSRVAAAGRVARLPVGAFFVCENEVPQSVALVGKGRLRVFKSSSNGREIKLYDVGPGELCLLNVLSMIAGVASPAFARVEEDLVAVLIPSDSFRRWLGTESTLRTYVFGALAAGVVEVMSLVEEITFTKLDIRLAEFLGGQFFAGGGQVNELRITHENIAAELGSAREVISRLLKEFERQGAVSLGRGRITLADAATLRGLAARRRSSARS